MLVVNIIRSYRDVVALCDKELLGKVFVEDEFQLDVKESFYKGEEKTPEETEDILRDFAMEDATFNIVGERACALALKIGLIDKEAVGKINNIPFALVLL